MILPISLKLNFTPITLGCYGLIGIEPKGGKCNVWKCCVIGTIACVSDSASEGRFVGVEGRGGEEAAVDGGGRRLRGPGSRPRDAAPRSSRQEGLLPPGPAVPSWQESGRTGEMQFNSPIILPKNVCSATSLPNKLKAHNPSSEIFCRKWPRYDYFSLNWPRFAMYRAIDPEDFQKRGYRHFGKLLGARNSLVTYVK